MSGRLSVFHDEKEKNSGDNNHQSPGHINRHPSHDNQQEII